MNLEGAHGARERVVAVDRHDDLEAGAPRGGEEVLGRAHVRAGRVAHVARFYVGQQLPVLAAPFEALLSQ